MGKWALDDKPQVQSPQSQQGGVPKQVGEDTAMAEAAKKAGVSSQQQQQTPESKSAPAPKDEGKKESGEKKFAHGKPNQVSSCFLLWSCRGVFRDCGAGSQ